jgi:hypothetical protein
VLLQTGPFVTLHPFAACLSDAPSPLWCRPILGATLDLLMHPDSESFRSRGQH